MKIILGIFFRLLYHQMAWSYDFIAALVSAGKWRRWVSTVTTFFEGPRILELGFGPGHLQVEIAKAGFEGYGIDESKQMVRMASYRVAHSIPSISASGYAHYPFLSRALAQHLPFRSESFNTVVSTFPSPYIFDPESLSEIYRVLNKNGKLIVLLSAKTAGLTLFDQLSNGLFHLTGEAAPIHLPILEPFIKVDFQVQPIFDRSPYGQVNLIIAIK